MSPCRVSSFLPRHLIQYDGQVGNHGLSSIGNMLSLAGVSATTCRTPFSAS